ncbi:MAG: hypothetical protein GX446_13575 [Chthonomonadales bacterium]|nr:hypothetical protein [Chthonomonadales bacterium]
MSWQRRLRHLALSQVRAIKERLDRIDAEMDDVLREREARDAALRELDEEVGLPPLPRSKPSPAAEPVGGAAPTTSATVPEPSRLDADTEVARACRILGVSEGADLAEVEAAYRKLCERCRSVEFPEGSEERETADAIMARVDEAYAKLREVLNPAAGRFDKLEL